MILTNFDKFVQFIKIVAVPENLVLPKNVLLVNDYRMLRKA